MKATEGADGTVFYIDRDSIKKEGSLIKGLGITRFKGKRAFGREVEESFGRV